LLSGLGKTQADDETLPLTRILEINGLDDALWALRCVDDQRALRLFWAASDAAWAAAWAAAGAAAWDAARAAWAAAWDAMRVRQTELFMQFFGGEA